jgi:hypothetical protein
LIIKLHIYYGQTMVLLIIINMEEIQK